MKDLLDSLLQLSAQGLMFTDCYIGHLSRRKTTLMYLHGSSRRRILRLLRECWPHMTSLSTLKDHN